MHVSSVFSSLVGAFALIGCAAVGSEGPDANVLVHNQAELLVEATESPATAAPVLRATARFGVFTSPSVEAVGDAEIPWGCGRVPALQEPEGGVRYVDVGARALVNGDNHRLPLAARRLPELSDHTEGAVFVSGTPEASPLTTRHFDLLFADGAALPIGALPETPALADGGLSRVHGDLRVALVEDAEFTAIFTFADGTRPALRCRFPHGVGVVPLPVDFAGGTLDVERSVARRFTIPGWGDGTAHLVARQRFDVAATFEGR
mgnify:FL=1